MLGDRRSLKVLIASRRSNDPNVQNSSVSSTLAMSSARVSSRQFCDLEFGAGVQVYAAFFTDTGPDVSHGSPVVGST
jgi:hypothetical protein